MTEQEAYQLAEEIYKAALPGLKLLNVLEGGLPDEPRHWSVRCRYVGLEKWHNDRGLLPGMTLAIMEPATWESIKGIIINSKPQET